MFAFWKSKEGRVTLATPSIAESRRIIAGEKIANLDKNYQDSFGFNPWTKETTGSAADAAAAQVVIDAVFAANRKK